MTNYINQTAITSEPISDTQMLSTSSGSISMTKSVNWSMIPVAVTLIFNNVTSNPDNNYSNKIQSTASSSSVSFWQLASPKFQHSIDEADVALESPNWHDPAVEKLAARNFKRQNMPMRVHAMI